MVAQIQGMITALRPTIFDSVERLAFNLNNLCTRQGAFMKKDNISRAEDNKRMSDGDSRGNSKQSLW